MLMMNDMDTTKPPAAGQPTALRIVGQKPLSGSLEVHGSKNAATKILVATLLTDQSCTLANVPRVEDVHRIIDLLQSLGAVIDWSDAHTLTVTCKTVDPARLDAAVVRKLRSSVVMIGALLGRSKDVNIPSPGGDQIGARPMDTHLDGLRRLGVSITEDRGVYHLRQESRGDVDLTLGEFSVTATENLILTCVRGRDWTTTIRCAAADPSVQDLCWFLQSLGANISGIGTHTLVILAVPTLHGTDRYTVMPDPVEAGTFLCLAAAARAPLQILGVSPDFLHLEFEKFRQANVSFECRHHRPDPGGHYALADISVTPVTTLRPLKNLHNMPWPGFSADLLPPFAVLLTQADGTSLVHDWMYEGRLKYVEELNKMGADIFIADPHRILIKGPSALSGTQFTNYDIRTGATGVIAGLIARGETTLAPVYQLDRGYERLDERLRAVGADITRVPITAGVR